MYAVSDPIHHIPLQQERERQKEREKTNQNWNDANIEMKRKWKQIINQQT